MTHRVLMSIAVFVCAATLLIGRAPSKKDIDFRNFTFAFPVGEGGDIPSKLTWMSLNVKGTITLVNGRYDFDKTNPSEGPSITLDRVLYGYLTSDMGPDAVVVLAYHTGGTAYWQYVYAYSLSQDNPKLVGWFRTGSRADFGLYRLEVGNRSLTVDLFDPARRNGDCCSDGFVRIHYDFRKGYFVQRGRQEFVQVEGSNPASEKSHEQ